MPPSSQLYRRERREIPGGLGPEEKAIVAQMVDRALPFDQYLQGKLDKVLTGTELSADERAEVQSKSDEYFEDNRKLRVALAELLKPKGFSNADAWQYTPEYNEMAKMLVAKEHAIMDPTKRAAFMPVPSRDIPKGSTDQIELEEIKDGDQMVDFNNEFRFGRYYFKRTLPGLAGKNPITREPIGEASYYQAKLVDAGGKRRRKTRRGGKKTRKSRKTRSRR